MTRLPPPPRRVRLEDAPAHAVGLLTAVHTRCGAGDGLVTSRMASAYLELARRDPEAQRCLRALSRTPRDGDRLLALALEPPAPPAEPTVEIPGLAGDTTAPTPLATTHVDLALPPLANAPPTDPPTDAVEPLFGPGAADTTTHEIPLPPPPPEPSPLPGPGEDHRGVPSSGEAPPPPVTDGAEPLFPPGDVDQPAPPGNGERPVPADGQAPGAEKPFPDAQATTQVPTGLEETPALPPPSQEPTGDDVWREVTPAAAPEDVEPILLDPEADPTPTPAQGTPAAMEEEDLGGMGMVSPALQLSLLEPTQDSVPPVTRASLAGPSSLMVEPTNPEELSPASAPFRVDSQGLLVADGARDPLAPGSPEEAVGLEALAQALEDGGDFPPGARHGPGQLAWLGRLESLMVDSLGREQPGTRPSLHLVRGRVAAAAVAHALADREVDDAVREKAGALLGQVLANEPRRPIRAALGAALCTLPDLPAGTSELVLSLVQGLVPKVPPYDAWAAVKPSTEPLVAIHHVYAPEYRGVKEAYEAAGYTRVKERPLLLRKDFEGTRGVRVEIRRVPAAVLLTEERHDAEVVILGGLAFAAEMARPPPFPRVVVATFRRDPFGVPRLAERFSADHLIASARGDLPLDDGAFHLALLYALCSQQPYALCKLLCRQAAPLCSNRTIWPHEPGALRAAGGCPSPFGLDQAALLRHRLTWAIPRPSRRPSDLKPRADQPDTTSYLALETAVGLAGTTFHGEDLPVLEPAGFHEGEPDVAVHVGPALWRVGISRRLCGQSEEALTLLVTLHVHARRAGILGQRPRLALLTAALRAAEVAVLQCATMDDARTSCAAVLAHAGVPSQVDLDGLLAAAADRAALGALTKQVKEWLDG